jgi:NADH-quinone oxidoreductase subunit N
MTINDLAALMPLIIIAAMPVAVMLVIAFYRSHTVSSLLSLGGLAAAFVALSGIRGAHRVTSLLVIDGYALFFTGLILAASFAVTLMSRSYLEGRRQESEEFYVLLLLATLGSSVVAASAHFASFFIGLEILTVSLYALIAYTRNDLNIEAGVKYLILAAASSAFLLFGIALVYGETGSMEFGLIASGIGAPDVKSGVLLAGFGMVLAGVGFKLALVPFHMWTPDVYEGAPAPATAFVATVSKGAVSAFLLRFFLRIDIRAYPSLEGALALIAVLSMFGGNLLALRQNNIKRILAYSSIAHLGYLLVAFLAAGSSRVTAVAFYLVAYFITTLGAFGVVTVLSGKERDADAMEDYRGLFARRPWLALIFSAMLFSLAGIPLTAGFIGKFYLVAAGAGAGLWLLVITLIINSAIGLYYYLRIIVALFTVSAGDAVSPDQPLSLSGSLLLVVLSILLLWLGVYPGPVIELIHSMTAGL